MRQSGRAGQERKQQNEKGVENKQEQRPRQARMAHCTAFQPRLGGKSRAAHGAGASEPHSALP